MKRPREYPMQRDAQEAAGQQSAATSQGCRDGLIAPCGSAPCVTSSINLFLPLRRRGHLVLMRTSKYIRDTPPHHTQAARRNTPTPRYSVILVAVYV